jgi:hypothetical protein
MKLTAALLATAYAATEVQNRPQGNFCVQKKGYNHYREHPIASIVEAGPKKWAPEWEPKAINAGDNTWFDARESWGTHWDGMGYPEAPEQSGLCATKTVEWRWWYYVFRYEYTPAGCNDLGYWGMMPGNANLADEPIFITADLGGVVSVGEIMVDHWGHFEQGDWNHAPSSIKVYGSKSLKSEPTLIKEFSTETGKNSCEPQYFYLPETKARYMRVEITGKHDKRSPYVVVDEIKFYGVPTGMYNKDGVKNHEDNFFNQITAAPTPVPATAEERFQQLKKNQVGGPVINAGFKYTLTSSLIPGRCYANNRDDQIEYITLDSATATSVSGTVGYKPVHSGGWTMSSGVSVQCWHYAGAWDSKPLLDKQDSGIGYGYGYGNGPSRSHKFTYEIQNADVKQHFIRCGIIDRSSSGCKFDSNTHCAYYDSGRSWGHHYDNADAPFTMEAASVRGNIDEQTTQTDREHQPTAMPTAFPTKDQSSAMGSVCKFGDFSKPVGWVGAGPGKYYCNVWKCEATKKTFTFKKSMKKCSVEEYGTSYCSHTTCKMEPTDVVLKQATLAIYSFDKVNGRDAFVNHINDANFNRQETVTENRVWNWSSWYWGSFTNRYRTTYIDYFGTCKIESHNGNMAWHVSANAPAKTPCSITTSTKMELESYWDECKFSLKVTDVDYEYNSKESNDQICFQVLNAQKKAVLESEVCQKDDIRRLLSYQNVGSSSTTRNNGSARCGWYGCIGWYGYGRDYTTTYSYIMKASNYGKNSKSKVISSDWIPTRNFQDGFFVKISAVTNDVREHWYADDLKIECREMRKVIRVNSDHREETGGHHVCGYSKHTDARSAGRPACDCLCKGDRRQDALGFERNLNEISKDFDVALNAATGLPAYVVYHFNFNDAGEFVGHMKHVVTTISAFRRYGYIWLTVTPVGTCAIEKWLDTTTSLGLQLGSDMAWHVQNNAQIGGCTMQTKNAWAPAKPDSYHSCKFTLDVYDLDEYKQEVRYYRTVGCYGPWWRRRCYWQYRQYIAHVPTSKESNDSICFQVVSSTGGAVSKKVCHNNDIVRDNLYLAVKRMETEYITIPDGGVNVKFWAQTNDEKEHWYADDMMVVCKLTNRGVSNTHDATTDYSAVDAKFNSNNFYSQHSNLDYNEKDHTYAGQRVAHVHIDN